MPKNPASVHVSLSLFGHVSRSLDLVFFDDAPTPAATATPAYSDLVGGETIRVEASNVAPLPTLSCIFGRISAADAISAPRDGASRQDAIPAVVTPATAVGSAGAVCAAPTWPRPSSVPLRLSLSGDLDEISRDLDQMTSSGKGQEGNDSGGGGRLVGGAVQFTFYDASRPATVASVAPTGGSIADPPSILLIGSNFAPTGEDSLLCGATAVDDDDDDDGDGEPPSVLHSAEFIRSGAIRCPLEPRRGQEGTVTLRASGDGGEVWSVRRAYPAE